MTFTIIDPSEHKRKNPRKGDPLNPKKNPAARRKRPSLLEAAEHLARSQDQSHFGGEQGRLTNRQYRCRLKTVSRKKAKVEA